MKNYHRTPPKEEYDVVIIGAGVGGLTAAALLSRSGLKVAVLEKEPHVGGYLAGFRRNNFRFDTAIHWLNQCSTQGMVSQVMDLIGNDYPRARTLQNIRRFKGPTHDYLLTNNPDDLKHRLIKEHPEDEKGIERFFKAAKKIGCSFDSFKKIFRADETMNFWEVAHKKTAQLQFALPFIPFLRFSGEEGFKKGMKKYFTNDQIPRIFSAESDLLSCLVPIGWAYYNDYQSPPTGGGQVIPEWLAHAATYYGADIICKSVVKEILVAEKTVRGVRVDFRGNEFEVKCKYVIAACDLGSVYNRLLPSSVIPDKAKEKLKKAELYTSSITISIALDCPTEELGFGDEMVHLCLEDIPKKEHYSGDPAKSSLTILAPSVKDKTLAPEGKGTLVLFMPATIQQFDKWATQKNEPGFERGHEYVQLKNSIAEKIIDRVQQALVPHLRQHILFYDVATPVTHWRYTWNEGGTMMGAKPGKNNMQNRVARYTTAVKNLFIGGHWAELGGGVPIATKAGVNASLLILKKEKRQIYNAFAMYVDGKYKLEKVNHLSDLKPYNTRWERPLTPAELYKKLKQES